MKRLISIFILLFLVGNSFAKTADFYGEREVVAAKERSYQGDLAAFGLQREAVRKMKAILDIKD